MGDKLYCAPSNAPGVLVIDPQAGTTRVIECGVEGTDKWAGVAALGDKLYCAPANAPGVLVIDPQAGTTRVIECGVAGNNKWNGIAALGDKLYCAPANASGMLVIDPQAGTTRVIESGVAGNNKWISIAAWGGKLHCGPHMASGVLVIDPQAGTTTVIESGVAGNNKWAGIAASGYKLHCAPWDTSGVLVIDPQAGTTTVIECDGAGSSNPAAVSRNAGRWYGILAMGDTLYCAPCCATGLLVIDPQAGTTTVVDCPGNRAEGWKWINIAALGDKLYCAPFNAPGVLVYSDANTRAAFAAAAAGTTDADAVALNDSCKGGIDRFGYRAYAQAFRAMLGRAAPPIAVGLYARWGSGKSFMIFLLKQQFDPFARTDPRTHDLVQWFEGGYGALPPSMNDDVAQAELSDKAVAAQTGLTSPPKSTTCRVKCAMLVELFGCCTSPSPSGPSRCRGGCSPCGRLSTRFA